MGYTETKQKMEFHAFKTLGDFQLMESWGHNHGNHCALQVQLTHLRVGHSLVQKLVLRIMQVAQDYSDACWYIKKLVALEHNGEGFGRNINLTEALHPLLAFGLLS